MNPIINQSPPILPKANRLTDEIPIIPKLDFEDPPAIYSDFSTNPSGYFTILGRFIIDSSNDGVLILSFERISEFTVSENMRSTEIIYPSGPS